MGGVVYKNDEFLLSLGYEGPDAYLRNGIPALETVRKANPKMLLFLLEWQRPEKWGKRRKIDVPQKCGVVIIGDVTKKPENSSAASIKARKWKSRSGMIRKAKAQLPLGRAAPSAALWLMGGRRASASRATGSSPTDRQIPPH